MLILIGRASTREVSKARRDFQRGIQEDIRQRVKAAGLTIEGLMAAGRVKEAWDHLARWDRHAMGRQVHPTREGMDR